MRADNPEETLQHRMMVWAAKRYLEAIYGDRPDVRVKTYVPVTIRLADDGETEVKNLDACVLDRDDNIIVGIAAERENRDRKRSNVDSYRTMEAADPDAAIFVLRNKTEAVHLLEDLYEAGVAEEIPYNGPLYSETTHPADYDIDQPGLTGIMTIRTLLQQFDHEWT